MSDLMKVEKSDAVVYSDPAAVAAAEAAKARIQAAYIMAYRNPRNIEQARVRILEACKRPQFAERAEYKKPVGGRSIKGPSVRLAELCIREWGNIMSDSQVLYEDRDIRRIRITLTDLETNASFGKEIQVHKTVERKKSEGREVVGERLNTHGDTVYIVLATEDELQNKEAAMVSKAVRNEGLRLIPSDIVDEAMDIAAATVAQRDSEDPAAAKKRIIDSFAAQGVKPKDLEKYLESPLDQITPADLQDLRATYQSIRDGETTWREVMAEKKGESPAAAPTPKDTGKVVDVPSDVELKDGSDAPEPVLNSDEGGTGVSVPVSGESATQGESEEPFALETQTEDPTFEVKVDIRELGEALNMISVDIAEDIDACDNDLSKLEKLRKKWQKILNEQNQKKS